MTLPDVPTLVAIASIVGTVPTAILPFRMQREIDMARRGENTWVPWAERLLLIAAALSLITVLLPMLLGFGALNWVLRGSTAVLAATIILVAGYPLALLAHYRFILSHGRKGPRVNPEPGEYLVVVWTAAAALAVGGFCFWKSGI